MSHRTVQLAAAAVAAFGLLAACGGGTGDTQAPSATAGSSAPSDGGGSGPKVPSPLPTKELLDNPCSVYNAAEAENLGVRYPGRKSTGVTGGCVWTSAAIDTNYINIGALPQNKNGLSDIYAQKDKQAYFTPTSIDGYPAVFADTQDSRPSGSCSLWVGVTDQLAVSVIPNISVGDYKKDPCSLAQKFATAMIGHLKGAS